MSVEKVRIPINGETDIALARLACRDLADRVDLGTVGKHCLITSVSELASNICVHAGTGTITLQLITREDGEEGIQVLARDAGQGIPDVGLALKDGFSSLGGLGGGLPGVKRLMSEMSISSVPGKGTVVKAVKWISEPPPAARLAPDENSG